MRNEECSKRNAPIVVIADDITGAAEIAGIAHSHGRQVQLMCSSTAGCGSASATGVTVIATDTRGMTEADAVAETRRIADSLLSPHSSLLIFKKTDSALRGHVVAELKALMQATGYSRAVFLPANPSRQRTVRNGVYYIKGVPIADTAFSYDPEFPARTSSLRARFPDAEAQGIIMPDAVTLDDIRTVVRRYDDGQTLFAGAADLFTEWMIPLPLTAKPHPSTLNPQPSPLTLILCGSTQSRPLDLGIPVVPMPREVYDGEQGADYWFNTFSLQPSTFKALVLTIPHTHRTGKTVAVHLRTVMAEMTKLLINKHFTPLTHGEEPGEGNMGLGLHLIIEGGATAWATLQALGWTCFTIEHQFAPGVVQMRAVNGTLVTLKPGSYPWGELFSR